MMIRFVALSALTFWQLVAAACFAVAGDPEMVKALLIGGEIALLALIGIVREWERGDGA